MSGKIQEIKLRKRVQGLQYKLNQKGVHKVQMKSTKVHPSKDAKYESQKEKKLNPVYNLGFTQK